MRRVVFRLTCQNGYDLNRATVIAYLDSGEEPALAFAKFRWFRVFYGVTIRVIQRVILLVVLSRGNGRALTCGIDRSVDEPGTLR